ncbi:hypothetical protein CEUSTIGMA_g4277.t1 [Chlamydomonas eustigma]|uniref:Aminotransferase class I/classII large domain-containing protein n=1 Tax=Chlamydomonas eustigma TaxID=1157962 RepID=A0A250X177_9CHLO|nr:hypothetical protein CEUSTIGMA_g4277.t1 [Chlamydomonas eustigma]|eukprot:GAX76831.1 hypothetical protein CEUSTIGMA_g4277.t1 [Chlamydomonas eustigma]
MRTTVDYDTLWSLEGKALLPPSLASFVQQFAGKEDLIRMHVGLPASETFPFLGFSANARRCDELVAISEPGSVSAAQQYSFGPGYPELLKWASNLVMRCHAPSVPYEIVMTAGAVHAISNIVSVLADRGDTIVIDEYAYVHVTECVLLPKGINLLPICMDSHGMLPNHLDQQLSKARLEASAAGRKPPKLLYTVPSGHNPTGLIMTVERKHKLYEVCQKHDVLIIEDDAYYWLQFYQQQKQQYVTATGAHVEDESRREQDHNEGRSSPSVQSHMVVESDRFTTATTSCSSLPGPSERPALDMTSDTPGLSQLPSSFLSMDTDSRVIRVDTLSKLMGPGYRLGWVTCAPKLASKLAMSVQGNCVGPSSLSMVLLESLVRTWGETTFEDFVRDTQRLYQRRGEVAFKAATQQSLRV